MSVDDNKKDEGMSDNEYDTIQEDIDQAVKKGNDQLGYGGPQKLSVSEGIRAPAGHYLIVGQIATVSSVYKMVSAVNLKCSCNYEWQKNYRQKPRIEVPSAGGFNCPSCNNEEASITVTPEWISTMDIQLQDTEKFNNIERLPTKFFEQRRDLPFTAGNR